MVDYIRWYEIRVYQRVWRASFHQTDRGWVDYPNVWLGTSQEFGNMVSISARELEMAEDDDMIWKFITHSTDLQMDEALKEWAGGSPVLLGPREWTCRPFWSSEWDYLKRKGLVQEQD